MRQTRVWARGRVPEKDRSTSGCESRPGKPPEEPGSQPPASGEILASKQGEARLQAATRVNSTPPRPLMTHSNDSSASFWPSPRSCINAAWENLTSRSRI
jgi:hypothetical protein